MNKWLWLGLGILVGLLAAGGLAFRQPYTLRGAEIEPAMPAPEIELPAANGDQFVLSQHKNEVVLIFFGYTHCPDVCPATLTEMKALLAQVGEKYQD
ncbi:MAG: SCO family protein, partial [Anaerolineaceae bacterium]|nr:SCO family protein [Anaerolineaceae bacterium]